MKIGDKVVFVGLRPGDGVPFNPLLHEQVGPYLVINQIYVIIGTYEMAGVLGLSLIGHTVIHRPTRTIVGYQSTGFRLLDELRQQNSQTKTQRQTL